MSFVRGFVRRPQRVWLRRLNFQIHLWIGLILTVYLIVIGLTGSILVFREELEGLAGLHPQRGVPTSGPYADPVEVIANLRAAFPQARVISLSAPTKFNRVYTAVSRAEAGPRCPATSRSTRSRARFWRAYRVACPENGRG